jgi:GTP-binding protein HflX
MDRALTADPVVEDKFVVPQREGAVLAALEAGALILKREFSGDFVDLAVAGPASLLARYRQYRQSTTGKKVLKVRTGRGGGSGATSHETGPV